jgi:hypothetical protein
MFSHGKNPVNPESIRWKVVRTLKGDWTKASHYFEEFHLNTNGAKYSSLSGMAVYGYDRDKPFGNRALFNFEAFDNEVWVEVELDAETAAQLDEKVKEFNRVESEWKEKENAICWEILGAVDEDIDKAIEKIGKNA